MKTTRLRAGVIGVGTMGENHARIYNRLHDAELVGVYDVDYERARQVAERFGTTVFRNPDELLDAGTDIVSVAVPASKHREVVSLCASAGCHILLEKPFAHRLEDANEMIMECELNGVRLMVGHVERFNPVVHMLKESLAMDDVMSVSITRVGPRPPRIKDVGVIKDMGIHDIDLLRYLTGKEIISLYSLVAGGEEKEDIGILSFRLEGDILAHLTVNWLTPFKVRMIQIAGSSGFVEGDLLHRKVRVYKKGVSGDDYVFSELTLGEEEPLEREIKAFIHCIKEGYDFPVSVYDAYRALEIAELCEIKRGELVICHSQDKTGGFLSQGVVGQDK